MRTIPELKEGTHRAKASGTLPNGKPVVVNLDGTVSVVEGSDASLGSIAVFESGRSDEITSTFDSSNNKVVIAYQDAASSNHGTAVVGTVSGTSISFGTPVVFKAGDTRFPAITFDSNSNKVVIAYRDNGNTERGTAIVGTVSGTSISFGTPVVFENNRVSQIGHEAATFDSNSNKIVIAYRDEGNSNYGTAIVGNVSGTSISFGTKVVFESGASNYPAITFDSNANKVVVTYRDDPASTGNAVVGTVSGTSISFGAPVVFASDAIDHAITFDSNSNKVVIAYQSPDDSYYGAAIVGTVSGTSISFGTRVLFENAVTKQLSSVFDSNSNKVAVSYIDQGNGDAGKIVLGTVSGTSISFESPLEFSSDVFFETSLAFDSNKNKLVISYNDDANSDRGTSVVFSPASTNLTSENYIGMSQGGSVASGSSATVDIIGSLSTNQSGLTAGQSYYVQTDGTIGTTPADPSVFAGTAISATSLVVKT